MIIFNNNPNLILNLIISTLQLIIINQYNIKINATIVITIKLKNNICKFCIGDYNNFNLIHV